MNKCQNCGTEFEGRFCPECGADSTKHACPVCGSAVKPGSKFCTACGAVVSSAGGMGENSSPSAAANEIAQDNAQANFSTSQSAGDESNVALHMKNPSSPLPSSRIADEEKKVRRKMTIVGAIPFVVGLLFSVTMLLLGLAPVAKMNDVIFGSGSQSIGNLYEVSGSDNPAAAIATIASAVIAFIIGAVGIFMIITKRTGKIFARFTARDILGVAFYPLCIATLIAAAAVCSAINGTDYAEYGMLSTGAWPICTIVFSVLYGLIVAAAQIYKIMLAGKHPGSLTEIKRENSPKNTKIGAMTESNVNAATAQKDIVLARMRSTLRLRRFSLWGLISCIIIAGTFFALIFSEIMAIVNLCKKKHKLSRNDEPVPATFFKKNRAKSALCCVLAFFTLAVVIFLTVVFITLLPYTRLSPLMPPSKSRLQIGGMWIYILGVVLFVALIVLLLLLTFFAVMALVNAISVKKWAYALNENSFPEYNGNREKLEHDISVAPLPKHARIIKRVVALCVAVCLLVAGLATGINIATNKFTPAKLNKIEIGATKTDVTQTLGEAFIESSGEWDYFSDNYVELKKKADEIKSQMEVALLSGDFEKVEKLEKKAEELTGIGNKMSFAAIRVMFDTDKRVARIEMFSGSRPSGRSMDAVLSEKSVALEDILSGNVDIYFTATDSDNTYVRARLGAEVLLAKINGVGTYTLEWEDDFGNYSAQIEVY